MKPFSITSSIEVNESKKTGKIMPGPLKVKHLNDTISDSLQASH